jgi:hypothetical protein
MTSIPAGLTYDRKDLEVMSSMRDFAPLVFGLPAAMMVDEDPRLEIDSAARLIAFWTHIGCSEEWQREQIDCYDQAKEALAAYRALKAGEGTVLVNQAIALQILKANLSDGAKVAALAALLTEARSARDIAASTGRSVRSVERHYSELRTWGCANLRRGEQYANARSDEAGNVSDEASAAGPVRAA